MCVVLENFQVLNVRLATSAEFLTDKAIKNLSLAHGLQPPAQMASEGLRPLLLPQNRRLRHLQGISLRNLTLTRPRGYTIDDAALNKTPAKIEALREPQLQHAQSSDNLNAKIRPGKPRRRSTIWTGQSPGYRQKKLEDVIEGGMADTFFSLHCEDVDEPIYVSEVVKAMVSLDMSQCVS